MAIDRASDPVVRLAIFYRQQPQDHIRPQRNSHLWPTPRHHDGLTNSETVGRRCAIMRDGTAPKTTTGTPSVFALMRHREAAD